MISCKAHGIVILGVLCTGLNSLGEPETPSVNVTDDAKLARAIQLLENPNWHETDRDIARLRERDARNPDVPSRIPGIVRSRETQAIRDVVGASIGDAEKTQLLERFLNHNNALVVGTSLSGLVEHGYWSVEKGIDFAERETDSKLLGVVFSAARKARSPEAALVALARRLLKERLAAPEATPKEPIGYLRGHVELDYVRTLLGSAETEDHRLIIATVLRYPKDLPLLWIAASRIPSPPELLRDACLIYEDKKLSIGLRCAAGLICAKENVKLYDEIIIHVLAFLDEFAVPAHEERLKQFRTDPLNPKAGESTIRFRDGQFLYGVLRELPDEVIATHFNRLIEFVRHSAGTGVAAILARRTPERFVDWIASSAEPNATSCLGAFVAARSQPAIAGRVIAWVPMLEWERLRKQEEDFGLEAMSGVGALMIWE